MIRLAVVADGLLREETRWRPHPALQAWWPTLRRRRARWFRCRAHNALSLLSAMVDAPPARLLAEGHALPVSDAAQWWVVTPWHGRTLRDHVRLLPAPALSWREEDASRMVTVLQPLLDELGMRLHVVAGSGLLLSCDRVWDVLPASYPQVEEEGLGNRHPPGVDGGAWMRLLAEIQMLLHRQGVQTGSGVPVHGIWLWGGWQVGGAARTLALPAVVCRDPLLRGICDGRDAAWMVGSVEEIAACSSGGSPPERVVLCGGGRALLLAGWRWFPFGDVLASADEDRDAEERMLWAEVAQP